MFRPINAISHKVSLHTLSKEFVRTKVVRPASILKPAEKIKAYNRENKELFGPLLETNRERKQRLQKEAKNTSQSKKTIDKVGVQSNDSKLSYLSKQLISPLNGIQGTMWGKTKDCVNFFSIVLNNGNVRCLSSSSIDLSAKSSPAQPGYVSEDKILQVKQHQNDYAKQYPSVTLILNKTMTGASKTALEKWKQEKIAELGEEEFKKFYEAQMAVGTKFHSTLKNYFTQPRSSLRIEKEVEGVWASVGDVLKSVTSPKAIESNVVHPVLKYRGIFDAIADYEDKPTLIEWKKSDKPRKSISLTYDNPVQLAAYYGAVCNDLNYKHMNVRDALLVIAYTDGSKADAYHFSMDKLREHWAQWLVRLEEYLKNHSNDSAKILQGGKRLFDEDIENLQ